MLIDIEEIKRMAHEAAQPDGTNPPGKEITLFAAKSALFLERFANLVAQRAAEQEREQCAKVCDAKAMRMEQEAQSAESDKEDATSLRSSAWLISVCAATIRARSNSADALGGVALRATSAQALEEIKL